MNVSQVEIDEINELKLRLIRLPVQFGEHGELRKCPARLWGVYLLKPQPPSETPIRTVTITVIEPPERQGDMWFIRLAKGDWRDRSDQAVFCSKDGGYTTVASRQAVPGDPEVLLPFAEDLAKARADAMERITHPGREILRGLKREVETCQQVMTNMRARNLVKRAQRDLEAAERILLSDGDVDSQASTAVAGSQGEADRPSRGVLSTIPQTDRREPHAA